jgi:hypothetical protein
MTLILVHLSNIALTRRLLSRKNYPLMNADVSNSHGMLDQRAVLVEKGDSNFHTIDQLRIGSRTPKNVISVLVVNPRLDQSDCISGMLFQPATENCPRARPARIHAIAGRRIRAL